MQFYYAIQRRMVVARNSERLCWDLFLRQFGPGEDNFGWAKGCLAEKERDAESHAEDEAALAHQDMLRRILTHYNGWIVNFQSMDNNEKAFASLFEELFNLVNDTYLFMCDIEYGRTS